MGFRLPVVVVPLFVEGPGVCITQYTYIPQYRTDTYYERRGIIWNVIS